MLPPDGSRGHPHRQTVSFLLCLTVRSCWSSAAFLKHLWVTDSSRRNVASKLREVIAVVIEMSATPIYPFEMSEQSLLTLHITFMNP